MDTLLTKEDAKKLEFGQEIEIRRFADDTYDPAIYVGYDIGDSKYPWCGRHKDYGIIWGMQARLPQPKRPDLRSGDPVVVWDDNEYKTHHHYFVNWRGMHDMYKLDTNMVNPKGWSGSKDSGGIGFKHYRLPTRAELEPYYTKAQIDELAGRGCVGEEKR